MNNLLLKIKETYRRKFNITKYGNEINLSSFILKENLKLNDFLYNYSWVNENEPYHPNKLLEYYDKTAVSELVNGTICIETKYEPKTFSNNITIPFKVGVLRSKNSYLFGYFEAEILLPYGEYLWPAFWLTGKDTWPPEIDIIEAYSKNNEYNDFKNLQTNVHYKKGVVSKMIGSENHPLPTKLRNSYVKYGVLWEKDKIEFYYNGYLVRRVSDAEVLSTTNHPMTIIINSAVETKYSSVRSSTFFKNIKVYVRK